MLTLSEIEIMAKTGDGSLLVIKWAGSAHTEYTTAQRIMDDIGHNFYTLDHFHSSATVERVSL